MEERKIEEEKKEENIGLDTSSNGPNWTYNSPQRQDRLANRFGITRHSNASGTNQSAAAAAASSDPYAYNLRHALNDAPSSIQEANELNSLNQILGRDRDQDDV